MKRTVTITWTCSENVTIDIPDYALTADEIKVLIANKADDIIPGGRYAGSDECCHEFQGEQPKLIGEGNIPPDNFWVTIGKFTIATNGYGLAIKGSPVEYVNTGLWRSLEGEKEALRRLEKILSIDTSKLPLHTGWFDNSFKAFEGYRAVGLFRNSEGYVLDDAGNVIAVLMPCKEEQIHDFSKVFQFNKKEAENQ